MLTSTSRSTAPAPSREPTRIDATQTPRMVRICRLGGNTHTLFGQVLGDPAPPAVRHAPERGNAEISVPASRVQRFGCTPGISVQAGSSHAEVQADGEANDGEFAKLRQLLSSHHVYLVLPDGTEVRTLAQLVELERLGKLG